MCCFFCKHLKAWCKSFTKVEICLSILEAVLLLIFIGLLIFTILHFLACANRTNEHENLTKKINWNTTTIQTESPLNLNYSLATPNTSISSGIKCTWEPSEKTIAVTQFFEEDTETDSISLMKKPSFISNPEIAGLNLTYDTISNVFGSDHADGEDADDLHRSHVLALVKLKPPKDIIFGCIITIVSEYWTITAASCLEAIEEMDSLDSFVMMEHYGSIKKSTNHVVFDIRIHPLYQNGNKSYDLALLQSEDSLVSGTGFAVNLPHILDYFLVNIGEWLTIIGFGSFRTIDRSSAGRGLRKMRIYVLPLSQCPADPQQWALRHLWAGAGADAGAGACGPGPLCAGVLAARASPCNYCSGTPLLRQRLLLGLMSDNTLCGVSCDPQLYVNVAASRDWIDSVIENK